MVEFVGLIKVNIIRGTNLVVRDMVSSDPYVVLSLGNQVKITSAVFSFFPSTCARLCMVIEGYVYLSMQSMKTRVIKNNINPVWNECLMLSIPANIPPLKLVSFFDIFVEVLNLNLMFPHVFSGEAK